MLMAAMIAPIHETEELIIGHRRFPHLSQLFNAASFNQK